MTSIPRTGRTATEGGLETAAENSIVLDGSAMNRILKIDTYNMQATAQCGVCLQDLEDECRKLGVTTGHSPQSKPIAQMGGLVATRSIGQFSTLYGGIEDMVVGLEAVFADGTVTRIKNVPRRSVGPDIRHVVIGNEGALCYVTEVTVKLFPWLPENNAFVGWTLKDMRQGFEALRGVMAGGYRPSVARLYDPPDGAFHFGKFAAKDDCVLLFMAEGPAGIVRATVEGIAEIVARFPGCRPVDPHHIAEWFADLNWGPDKIANERKEILATRAMGRTTEIAADWSTASVTWNARPETDAELAVGTTEQGQRSSFDVSSYVTDVLSHGVADHGLMLSGDGSGSSSWKRLVADDVESADMGPLLVVTWSGLRPNPVATDTESATNFEWALPALAGSQTRFQVEVSNDGFATVLAGSDTVKGKLGKIAAWTLPSGALSNSGSYEWRVRVKFADESAWSEWSSPQSFSWGSPRAENLPAAPDLLERGL